MAFLWTAKPAESWMEWNTSAVVVPVTTLFTEVLTKSAGRPDAHFSWMLRRTFVRIRNQLFALLQESPLQSEDTIRSYTSTNSLISVILWNIIILPSLICLCIAIERNLKKKWNFLSFALSWQYENVKLHQYEKNRNGGLIKYLLYSSKFKRYQINRKTRRHKPMIILPAP